MLKLEAYMFKVTEKTVRESHCVLVLDIFNVHLTAAW